MVAACCCFPQSVNGGGFLKAALMPLKPHTPDRSRGLNVWPSTLYFTFPSALSLLSWHRGHCFHPSGAGTETGAWTVATTGKARAATNTRMEIMVCFRIWKSSFLSGDIRGILQRKGNVHKRHKKENTKSTKICAFCGSFPFVGQSTLQYPAYFVYASHNVFVPRG